LSAASRTRPKNTVRRWPPPAPWRWRLRFRLRWLFPSLSERGRESAVVSVGLGWFDDGLIASCRGRRRRVLSNISCTRGRRSFLCIGRPAGSFSKNNISSVTGSRLCRGGLGAGRERLDVLGGGRRVGTAARTEVIDEHESDEDQDDGRWLWR